MFQNYLKSALRNIKRQKGYSLITIAGLFIGITCFVLISLYVQYEFSYDRFHENAQNIYRMIVDTRETYMGKSQVTVTPAPLASAMQGEFPEVLKATKVESERVVMKYGEHRFSENRIYYVDPAFLDIFNFPLLAGNPKTALNKPNCLLVSKDMAEKYFGQENPVGKTIDVDKKDYQITGVLENIPGNTHFRFDFLASFSSLVELYGRDRVYNWGWSYYTYVLLHGQADPVSLENKLVDFLKRNYREDATQTLRLQPVADIHFYTKANFEIEPTADIRNVYLLSAIAFFILLIACFNYMNLSTARATTRAKEIGMRKVIGANRMQLIRQFLGESTLFSLIALFISVMLVKLFLPAFRVFIDRKLEAGVIQDGTLILTLIGLVLFVGLVSGSYPSLVLSSFQPTAVLKGTGARSSRSSSLFRNSLVVSQFVISAALIFCTIVVFNQLHFMRNKELGFVKDYVVTVPNPARGDETLKNKLRQNTQVLDVTSSNDLPYDIRSADFGKWDGYNPEEKLIVYRNWVDANFLSFYDIPVVQGRGFAEEYNDKEGQVYILNEAAVKAIGWDDPIGKRFGFRSGREEKKGVVVGVVKDFHFAPLHLNIEPLALTPNSERIDWLSIKISSQNIPETLAFIERTWKRHSPEGDFSYTFLDDRLDRLYRTEEKLGKTFSIYTFIALFVACLGLFGLASFTTAQRTKEIGIRKVLGATGWNITLLTTKKIMALVLMANAIAWPVAYFAMQNWLQNFAYRTEVGVWIFALSATLSLAIALLTVSYQTIKAATANPVDSLRYE
jgi:putative ABC transport system permease protein